MGPRIQLPGCSTSTQAAGDHQGSSSEPPTLRHIRTLDDGWGNHHNRYVISRSPYRECNGGHVSFWLTLIRGNQTTTTDDTLQVQIAIFGCGPPAPGNIQNPESRCGTISSTTFTLNFPDWPGPSRSFFSARKPTHLTLLVLDAGSSDDSIGKGPMKRLGCTFCCSVAWATAGLCLAERKQIRRPSAATANCGDVTVVLRKSCPPIQLGQGPRASGSRAGYEGGSAGKSYFSGGRWGARNKDPPKPDSLTSLEIIAKPP